MTLSEFQKIYAQHPYIKQVIDWSKSDESNLQVSGLNGSSRSLVIGSLFLSELQTQVLVAQDEEEAGYIYNDLKQLLAVDQVFYFPSSYKKSLKLSQLDLSNNILRTEVLSRLVNSSAPLLIVTYPEGLMQKVMTEKSVKSNKLHLKIGENLEIDFIEEFLFEFGFSRVDFVYEPGQFSVRGSIVDIFSFSHEMPYRCDFFGNELESIRIFDIETQLSKEKKDEIIIMPDFQKNKDEKLISFFEFIPQNVIVSFTNAGIVYEKLNNLYNEALIKANDNNHKTSDLLNCQITGNQYKTEIEHFRKIEWSEKNYFGIQKRIRFKTFSQPIFHKNFDLITENLKQQQSDGYKIYILSDSIKQTDRIASIFDDRGDQINFIAVKSTLHEGFIDTDLSMVCYTDHQIFDRFHKYLLKTDKTRLAKVVMTLKELNQFQLGDYMVHVDHGVGKFGGLVKTSVNGKMQEMVKLIYKDDDIIFVSIHSLHRISKYKGKEGESPHINKLGSGAWERLKERTKSKVKDIARELIKLYAKRKAQNGFSYSPDSYLQQELEASFIYEDTPDQIKATADVKKDMESVLPMDRLICGDVGFGKTEVAMRAAFKAATDGKQVAVLVPTTVLALQHYNTFKDRFKDFPVTVDYISRAKTTKQTHEIFEKLTKGEIDVIIGTHKLLSKSIHFKDLGLLIIDEEQKFGVSVKEKLKEMKINVDTITMTATPIPRTLQFSLMGARDLSIINTPPPNRYPVHTELHTFDEDIIREAIQIEMNRNGQVFFINNRIQNIYNIESMIRRIVPGCRTIVGHGQMSAEKLEEVIIDFINYEYDVLIATTIIESGIDIPNVNTIIINSAHCFGLSDLHQLRGRVGRSNKKAYCYLITPELSLLNNEAKRRLQAIETFTELGSGFNIAMQDLDIRGAGNLLGAEQSGFIADLGYETYQRILNEAVNELKEEEFADLYTETRTTGTTTFITDCQIDTDMELMFDSSYIENVSERITLYRELDNIGNEAELVEFENRLTDRFGKIPEQALNLIQVVRLRWLAMEFGVERLVLKNGKMQAFLLSNFKSPYYQSDKFGKLLHYMSQNYQYTKLKEQNKKRSAIFLNINSIDEAMRIFSLIRN